MIRVVVNLKKIKMAKNRKVEKKNENIFTLKSYCKIGEIEYQKGDTIEVKSKKGIEFLRAKNLID
jgi:hypothetical protein